MLGGGSLLAYLMELEGGWSKGRRLGGNRRTRRGNGFVSYQFELLHSRKCFFRIRICIPHCKVAQSGHEVYLRIMIGQYGY